MDTAWPPLLPPPRRAAGIPQDPGVEGLLNQRSCEKFALVSTADSLWRTSRSLVAGTMIIEAIIET